LNSQVKIAHLPSMEKSAWLMPSHSGHPQRLHVPGRHDMLRVHADLVLVDHLQRGGVDHPDVVRAAVGHVDALQVALDRLAELAGGRLAVQVGRIRHGRHARHGLDGTGSQRGAAGRHREQQGEGGFHGASLLGHR